MHVVSRRGRGGCRVLGKWGPGSSRVSVPTQLRQGTTGADAGGELMGGNGRGGIFLHERELIFLSFLEKVCFKP
jgi:hypothetical protein